MPPVVSPVYADSDRLRDGRQRYFEAWGFGESGYEDRWVVLARLGPVPVLFLPNTNERVRSVRLHDLHHVLTGYRADWIGEAEIGAWEVGAGCGNHLAAWVLNLSALGYGFFLAPAKVTRAFARGRRSKTLYNTVHDFDPSLLDRTIGAMRRELGLDAPAPEPTPADRIALAQWLVVSGALYIPLAAVVVGVTTALFP